MSSVGESTLSPNSHVKAVTDVVKESLIEFFYHKFNQIILFMVHFDYKLVNYSGQLFKLKHSLRSLETVSLVFFEANWLEMKFLRIFKPHLGLIRLSI